MQITFADTVAVTIEVNRMSELRTNFDWAGYFKTMAERMMLCELKSRCIVKLDDSKKMILCQNMVD